MTRKFALVIGNTEYTDPGLLQLSAPGVDAQDFALVLGDRAICAFDDVKVVINEPSSAVIEAIDEFFDAKKPDDLLVLYFSGHGVRDELGSLYLGCKNTLRTRLRATAIKSDYIRESMDQSRSKRQVVILDCCNSGAFPQGTKAEIGGRMGLASAFQGYGRFVLMASDATQFAWEGDRVIGETSNSLFTHFLIKGLEGEADSDGDGKITVDELYDYAFEQVSKVTEKQSPTKAASKVEGDIILRHITRLEDIKSVPLPRELLDEVEDTRPYVREAAVQKLERILTGANLGLARSAVPALEKIASDENTTRRVAQAASQALQSYRERIQKEMQAGEPAGPQPDALHAEMASATPEGSGPQANPEQPPSQPSAAAQQSLAPLRSIRSQSQPAQNSGAKASWRSSNRQIVRAGAIVGVLAIGLVAIWLWRARSLNVPAPSPTGTIPAETSTSLPADTPTAEPTSLDTATAIPSAAPTDQSSASSAVEPHVGSAVESLAAWNKGAASLWDKATSQNAKLDDSQPGIFTYPVVVDRAEQVRWEWFWCAQSQAILEDNLKSVNLKFDLDGQDVTPALQNMDFQNGGWACRTFFVSIDNWPAGTFHLTNTLTITKAVNDGSSDYSAGEYVYKYAVTVQ